MRLRMVDVGRCKLWKEGASFVLVKFQFTRANIIITEANSIRSMSSYSSDKIQEKLACNTCCWQAEVAGVGANAMFIVRIKTTTSQLLRILKIIKTSVRKFTV